MQTIKDLAEQLGVSAKIVKKEAKRQGVDLSGSGKNAALNDEQIAIITEQVRSLIKERGTLSEETVTDETGVLAVEGEEEDLGQKKAEEKLAAANSRLREKNDELRQMNDELKSANTLLAEQIERLSNANLSLKEKNEELSALEPALAGQNEKLKAEIEDLKTADEAKIADITKKLEELTEVNVELIKKKDAAESANKTLSAQLDTSRGEKQKLSSLYKKNLDSLRAELKQNEEKRIQIESEIDQIREFRDREVELLETQIAQLTEQMRATLDEKDKLAALLSREQMLHLNTQQKLIGTSDEPLSDMSSGTRHTSGKKWYQFWK